ncbi:MAG: DNA recombination protein RmuC, partial [Sphaerochaetaceae bacterium]|nr:DNA recombination protein RmuC [Sphaerochaetaceae bacterium]
FRYHVSAGRTVMSSTLLISLVFLAFLLLSVSMVFITMRSIARRERLLQQMMDQQSEKSAATLTQMASLTQTQLYQVNETIDRKIASMQESTERRLEQIRTTVDTQLHDTLEKRLGESFKVVSEQLNAVNRGLGEMSQLADGVGDLKRVLTNVKSRGTWGEFQLHAILEEMLTPSQYITNAAVKKGSAERVEFAIRLPGAGEDEPVLLPIDAKFPKEDYERLVDAREKGDALQVEMARKAILTRVKKEAKDISEKYINVPVTTDFAVLFLPTEGLYAEVLQDAVFVQEVQRLYRVSVAGPTTLAALLNSLQMGFRTLAIQKRSSEVWHLLSKVKGEISTFGLLLDKMRKHLDLATSDLSQVTKRSDTIQKKLRSV